MRKTHLPRDHSLAIWRNGTECRHLGWEDSRRWSCEPGKEISTTKARFVVVQDSQWLAERGCTPFVTNLLGNFYITRPYYAETSEGLSIELPPFNAVPFPQRGQKSVREHLLQDWFRVLVQFVRSNLQAYRAFYLQQLFGLKPKPATDLDAVREDGLRRLLVSASKTARNLSLCGSPDHRGRKSMLPLSPLRPGRH